MLIDTCGLLRLVFGTLSDEAKALLDSDPDPLICPVSYYEIGFKNAIGKLELPIAAEDLRGRVLESYFFREVAVDGEITSKAATLPIHHRDPFDRILIATALRENVAVLTDDRRFADYGVNVVPC